MSKIVEGIRGKPRKLGQAGNITGNKAYISTKRNFQIGGTLCGKKADTVKQCS